MITLSTRWTTKSTSLRVLNQFVFTRNLSLRIRRHRSCELVTFPFVCDKLRSCAQPDTKASQNTITYTTFTNVNQKIRFGSMNYIPLLPHKIVYPPKKVRQNDSNNYLVFKSPPFSIARIYARSIFLETSLKTRLDSKSLFPNVENAKSDTTVVAKLTKRVLVLRGQRIVQLCFVESIQNGTCD